MTYADPHGLEPLLEANHRRRLLGLQPLQLTAMSNPIRQLFSALDQAQLPALDTTAAG